MITFSNLGLQGRLGNQLYQYALVKSVSIRTGKELQLPDLTGRSHHGQKCLLPKLNLKYKPLITNPRRRFVERIEQEYDQSVFLVEDDTDFFGYFQNKKYFENIKSVLQEEFTCSDEEIVSTAKNIIDKYTNPTSIHIRLGDYNYTNYYDILFSYINKAIETLNEDCDFLVFTGGSRNGNDDRDNDFNLCKTHLKGERFHFIEGKSELVDFEIIKQCKNNITGFDSSFSWWASYLNKQEGKIICTNKYQTLKLYNDMNEWITL